MVRSKPVIGFGYRSGYPVQLAYRTILTSYQMLTATPPSLRIPHSTSGGGYWQVNLPLGGFTLQMLRGSSVVRTSVPFRPSLCTLYSNKEYHQRWRTRRLALWFGTLWRMNMLLLETGSLFGWRFKSVRKEKADDNELTVTGKERGGYFGPVKQIEYLRAIVEEELTLISAKSYRTVIVLLIDAFFTYWRTFSSISKDQHKNIYFIHDRKFSFSLLIDNFLKRLFLREISAQSCA